MRKDFFKEQGCNPTIHDYYENFEKIRSSKIYRALGWMPKGGHHHLHLTAAAPLDLLIDLTYDDRVYFSQKDSENQSHMFKVICEGDSPPSEYI